ncbi:MAG: aspartyl protease family protein [Pseudomonadota bacterium]
MSRSGALIGMLCTAVLGFGLGWWFALPSAPLQPVAEPPTRPPAANSVANRTAAPGPLQAARRLLAQKSWFALEQWLRNSLPGSEAEPEEQALLNAEIVRAIAAQANKHDALVQLRVLDILLVERPGEVTILQHKADLQILSGRLEPALETYFQILDQQPLPEIVADVWVAIERLTSALDAQFKSQQSHAARVAFWRQTTARYPPSDQFRLQLAKALIGAGDTPAAQQILRETGTADITAQARDEVEAMLNARTATLDFDNRGDRILADVRSAAGLQMTLLVDSGATITALSRDALRRAGARRAGRSVRLQTAGGVVEADVYTVDELWVQGRSLREVTVVELPVELAGLDGLLGTDLLRRLNWAVDKL